MSMGYVYILTNPSFREDWVKIGKTRRPVNVRSAGSGEGNTLGDATYRCDSRLNSGYGRFTDNTYAKAVHVGVNNGDKRLDGWDYVLSDLELDGAGKAFLVDVGLAGRVVNCRFRNMAVGIANAYACSFENCTDASTYLPSPGGRWYEVSVKGCSFSRFSKTNDWERCRFTETKLNGFNGGSFTAKNSVFNGCSFFGLRHSSLAFTDCTFDKTTLQGNYWERPTDFLFRNCTITTAEEAPFLRLGLYTVGRIGFDRCTVAGRQSLVDVKDLRRIQLLPHEDPATNPDKQPGVFAFRRITWKSDARTVLTHAKDANPSPKPVTIRATDTTWPKGVTLASDLPSTWKLNSK